MPRKRTNHAARTRIPPETGQTTSLDLRAFVVDPYSPTIEWASTENPRGSRADRLVCVLETELMALRPVALGVMMPTWIPITHAAAARYGAKAIGRGLGDLSWLLTELRTRVPTLRGFVRWAAFREAPAPKLFLWEAFKPEQRSDADLSTALSTFIETMTAQEHGAVIATDDVLSVIGALLLRTGLTDDVDVLSTPCVLVGRPTLAMEDERLKREDRRKRDDEFISYLVRQAIKQWYTHRGLPRIGEILGREPTSPDTPRNGGHNESHDH